MKHLLTISLISFAICANAQKPVWSHAIGNWRNGPVVYLTPVIETNEAVSIDVLTERFRAEFPVLRDVADLDVLMFADPEDGEESRRTLMAKYAMRKLEVQQLVAPTGVIEKD